MVSPVTPEEALTLGKQFNQDSVLTNRGLMYHDDTVTPAQGAEAFTDRPEDFFSIIETPNGPVNFRVNLEMDADGNFVRNPLQQPQAPQAQVPAPTSPILRGLNGRPGGAAPHPSLISTRRPSPANYATQGDPNKEVLIQTGQSLLDAPKALERNMQQLLEEPFMHGVTGSPEEIYAEGLRRMSDNLKFITNDMMDPSLVDDSRGWYNTANRMGTELAEQYGITPEASFGVNAALSPQKAWPINVANQERLLAMHANDYDTGMSNPGQAASSYIQKALDALKGKQKPTAIAQQGPEFAARVMETPMNELTDPFERYTRVVLTDALTNNPSVPNISPDGVKHGDFGKIIWGSSNQAGKALNILDDGSVENIGRQLNGGGKVPTFYNNQAVPDSPLPFVTADTHSAGAASMYPAGADDTITYRTMGLSAPSGGAPAASNSAVTGSKGLYGLVTDAYVAAGQELGMLPREVQSATWEGVRAKWGDEGKTPALKKAVEEAWRKAKNPQEARRAIADLLGG